MTSSKKEDELDDKEVQDKASAAIEYCNYASEYNKENNGKLWKYVLIPDNAVQLNMSFKHLVNQYIVKEI
ncbi:MAG: hypothetical protein A2254_16635 [Ignavibacteria bacterium RIFOXYA2_FULL_35_9]|nr:MAG: hypothetical protein A2254_16635 [Ignavibacteria bacterium RIFOXYA2_FULL_35_9]